MWDLVNSLVWDLLKPPAALILTLWPVILPIGVLFAVRRIKIPWIRNLLATAALSALVALGLFLWHIRNPRIIARAVAPNDVELCVVQVCNWVMGEPFTTSVYYRKPSSSWGWFYYDHQDIYWESGRADIDPKHHLITIYRGKEATATFDYASETFTLQRSDWPRRVYVGAQEWKPSTWTFADISKDFINHR
jgi:hypothetical protein